MKNRKYEKIKIKKGDKINTTKWGIIRLPSGVIEFLDYVLFRLLTYLPKQTEPNQTKPNQTKPNQTKPNQTKPNQTKTWIRI